VINRPRIYKEKQRSVGNILTPVDKRPTHRPNGNQRRFKNVILDNQEAVCE